MSHQDHLIGTAASRSGIDNRNSHSPTNPQAARPERQTKQNGNDRATAGRRICAGRGAEAQAPGLLDRLYPAAT